jgi:ribosomal protein L15
MITVPTVGFFVAVQRYLVQGMGSRRGEGLSRADTLVIHRSGKKAGRGQDGPARRERRYVRTALAFSGSQILMWRVSGIMNRQMMKHTAGTTMG